MGFQKILVPLGGSPVDRGVIELACHIAKKGKGRLILTHIIEVKRSLPLEARLDMEIGRGERILEQAEQMVAEEGCEAETSLLQAREAGAGIVVEAEEKKVDLILMGITYKRRFGEFSLGKTVPYVLKNAPGPVVLYRQPLSGEVEDLL